MPSTKTPKKVHWPDESQEKVLKIIEAIKALELENLSNLIAESNQHIIAFLQKKNQKCGSTRTFFSPLCVGSINKRRLF